MPEPIAVPVERALAALAAPDATGLARFRAGDLDFGLRLHEVAAAGITLTGPQRRAAHRMLLGYAEVLPELAAWPIIEPDAAPTPPPIPAGSARLTVLDGRIVARTPFALKDHCKAVPGARWDPKAKAWTWPATPTAALAVAAGLGHARPVTDTAFDDLVAAARDEIEKAEAIRSLTDEAAPPIPHERTASWGHQRRAFHFARGRSAVALAMDMGTGKSKVVVDLISDYALEGKPGQQVNVLILCPSKVIRVWPREFRIHAGAPARVLDTRRPNDKPGGRRVAQVPIADRVRMADTFLHEDRYATIKVVVTNYEALYAKVFADWAATQEWNFFIMDESQKIRAHNGTRSKACARITATARRRGGIFHAVQTSGTFMAQTPLDVFGQFRALYPDVYGTTWTGFRSKYAIMGGFEGKQIVGYRNEDDLTERYRRLAFEVGAEVLDLPPVRPDMVRYCTLSREARSTYNQLHDSFVTWVEDTGTTAAAVTLIATTPEPVQHLISGQNVLTRLLRQQEITGGSVHDDDGLIHRVDDSKSDLLGETIDELGVTTPIVVFCRFVADLDRVAAVAAERRLRYGELSGRRSDLDDDACYPVDIDILAVQMQAGGVGIDLTRAHHAIYYSLGFSLSDYKQSRARLVRPGQTESVLFVHLVAEDTVDEDVYAALERRADVIEWILHHLDGTDDDDDGRDDAAS